MEKILISMPISVDPNKVKHVIMEPLQKHLPAATIEIEDVGEFEDANVFRIKSDNVNAFYMAGMSCACLLNNIEVEITSEANGVIKIPNEQLADIYNLLGKCFNVLSTTDVRYNEKASVIFNEIELARHLIEKLSEPKPTQTVQP